MSYHLYQVESLLKKAYDHAKNEMGKSFNAKHPDGYEERRRMVTYPGESDAVWRLDEEKRNERFNMERIPNVKPGSDVGHGKALDMASTVPYQTIAQWHDHPPLVETDDYAEFFVRAMWYLHLRGIPLTAQHAKEKQEQHYYDSRQNRAVRTWDRKGHGVWTIRRNLKLVEVALMRAGIPMWEPAAKRFVDEKYGIIRSPITGFVKVAFVTTRWGQEVFPNDAVFKLEQWQTPSWNRDVKVISLVGGEVTTVLARPGTQVQKDQELLRVKNPWVKQSLHLPRGELDHLVGTQQPDGPNTGTP